MQTFALSCPSRILLSSFMSLCVPMNLISVVDRRGSGCVSKRRKYKGILSLRPRTGTVGTSNEDQRSGGYELTQGAKRQLLVHHLFSLRFSATNCESLGQFSSLGCVKSDLRNRREVRRKLPVCELPNQERRRAVRKFLTRHLSCWRLLS